MQQGKQAIVNNLPGINTSIDPNEITLTGNFYDVQIQEWVSQTKKKLIPFFVQIKNSPFILKISLDYISIQCLEGIHYLLEELLREKKKIEVQWIVDTSSFEYMSQMGQLLENSLPGIPIDIVQVDNNESQKDDLEPI